MLLRDGHLDWLWSMKMFQLILISNRFRLMNLMKLLVQSMNSVLKNSNVDQLSRNKDQRMFWNQLIHSFLGSLVLNRLTHGEDLNYVIKPNGLVHPIIRLKLRNGLKMYLWMLMSVLRLINKWSLMLLIRRLLEKEMISVLNVNLVLLQNLLNVDSWTSMLNMLLLKLMEIIKLLKIFTCIYNRMVLSNLVLHLEKTIVIWNQNQSQLRL
jgi:hypothetical protein